MKRWTIHPVPFLLLQLCTLSLAQDPTPIASTPVDDLRLELFTVNPKDFGLDGRDELFPFARDDALERLTGNFTLGPWESSRGSTLRTDELVLGFLLRKADGELPGGRLRTATAYRVTNQAGEESAYWPLRSQYAISEVSNYMWDYNLAPLVLAVPKGTTEITKLEGAIVRIPQRQNEIVFSEQDFKDNAAGVSGRVAVFALGRSFEQQHTIYEMVIARASQVVKTDTGRNRVVTGIADNNKDLMNLFGGSVDYAVEGWLSYGERVAPNLFSNVQAEPETRRQLVRKMVNALKEGGTQTGGEEAIKKIITDPKAELNFLRVGFRGDVDFDSLKVRVSLTTGMPQFRPFEMKNIPVPDAADVKTINQFVSRLPIEPSDSLASSLDFRTWNSANGAYSVRAKLLGTEGDLVVLEKEDGKTVKVPRPKLSEADQKYLSDIN